MGYIGVITHWTLTFYQHFQRYIQVPEKLEISKCDSKTGGWIFVWCKQMEVPQEKELPTAFNQHIWAVSFLLEPHVFFDNKNTPGPF